MYILQIRYKKDDNSFTDWTIESTHNTIMEGFESMGEYIAKYFASSIRLITDDHDVVSNFEFYHD